MRKVLISMAAAASAVALASPASAQYYPQPQGYAYGYNNPYNYGQIRRFEVRIMQLRNEIRRQDIQGRLTRSEAARLDRRAAELHQQLMYSARNGLSRRERVVFDSRIDRLRAQMRAEMRDGRRFSSRNYRYDRDRYRYDRDRDGRDDRYEDDRGWRHD
jgi:hypothetical protein